MDESLGCSTRTMAIAGLVAYGATLVFVVLTLKYPRFGAPSNSSRESWRLPPQVFLAFLTGIFTFGVTVMLGLVCWRSSIASRRWAWTLIYSPCIIAGLLGPALFIAQPHLSPTTWVAVTIVSALGMLLTLLVTLLYALRSPSA